MPEISTAHDRRLGLTEKELDDFADNYELSQVAAAIGWRGDVERLRTVAGWGSVLGDIASIGRPTDRYHIVREAAAFNLGIALFDSVIEKDATLSASLAKSLAPELLRKRLQNPWPHDGALICPEPALSRIVRLFDQTVSGCARRFYDQPDQIEYFAGLLTIMYRSELGLSPDLLASKHAPVVFIGALGNPVRHTSAHKLFKSLGHFFRLWDDWLDLEEDMWKLAPNSFLGTPHSVVGIESVRYVSRSVARIVGGRTLHPKIAVALSTALRDIAVDAKQWNHQAYEMTLTLCREFVH